MAVTFVMEDDGNLCEVDDSQLGTACSRTTQHAPALLKLPLSQHVLLAGCTVVVQLYKVMYCTFAWRTMVTFVRQVVVTSAKQTTE